MGSLRERVEEFLFDEAKLIDEHRYEEWLALWT
jgi:3-phenylpropionate/cinnamic acid dioxygenase small subunit